MIVTVCMISVDVNGNSKGDWVKLGGVKKKGVKNRNVKRKITGRKGNIEKHMACVGYELSTPL